LLEPYLPPGTELDYHEGKTYLSLVGFLFAGTRIFGLPIPRVGTFEEINLRFYVVRKEDKLKKRGVVFIQEAVPFKSVARMANWLYSEHYAVIPTYHSWQKDSRQKEISYYWKKNGHWNHLKAFADVRYKPMAHGSIEEFIFEHYHGYAKMSDSQSSAYEVEHPRWMVHEVHRYEVACNFGSMYGEPFAFLSDQVPASVMLARGSKVAVKWKRKKITHSRQAKD
jgi:uncharacterized protein YqjF (DUF2071 family)